MAPTPHHEHLRSWRIGHLAHFRSSKSMHFISTRPTKQRKPRALAPSQRGTHSRPRKAAPPMEIFTLSRQQAAVPCTSTALASTPSRRRSASATFDRARMHACACAPIACHTHHTTRTRTRECTILAHLLPELQNSTYVVLSRPIAHIKQ